MSRSPADRGPDSAHLPSIVDGLRERLLAKNRAREAGLSLAREAIRTSANAIRAIHRHEFDLAQQLIAEAGRAVTAAGEALRDDPDILHAGFISDAQKEYAEARLTLALVTGAPVPAPEALGVGIAAYLNGLAETVGELRRHLLDFLRRGEVTRCETLLDQMDEIYTQLVTIDFPDAMTGGLRRSTDNARGILERTRGDLTVALRQTELERRLAALADHLGAHQA